VLPLDQLRCEQFAACLNQDFEILFSDGTLPVKLVEAKPWGPKQPPPLRQPFTLTFRAERNLRFPQGIYQLRNTQLGEMEIFLVQVSADANTSAFEAVFN
jgi:hypothetical protein